MVPPCSSSGAGDPSPNSLGSTNPAVCTVSPGPHGFVSEACSCGPESSRKCPEAPLGALERVGVGQAEPPNIEGGGRREEGDQPARRQGPQSSNTQELDTPGGLGSLGAVSPKA